MNTTLKNLTNIIGLNYNKYSFSTLVKSKKKSIDLSENLKEEDIKWINVGAVYDNYIKKISLSYNSDLTEHDLYNIFQNNSINYNINLSSQYWLNSNYEQQSYNMTLYSDFDIINFVKKLKKYYLDEFPELNILDFDYNNYITEYEFYDENGISGHYKNIYSNLSITFISNHGIATHILLDDIELNQLNFNDIIKKINNELEYSNYMMDAEFELYGKIKLSINSIHHIFNQLTNQLNIDDLSGQSTFKKYINSNENILSSQITIIDNPMLDKCNHHFKFDAEGIESTEKMILTNGKITDLLGNINKFEDTVYLGNYRYTINSHSDFPFIIQVSNLDIDINCSNEIIDYDIYINKLNTMLNPTNGRIQGLAYIELNNGNGEITNACINIDISIKKLFNEVIWISEKKTYKNIFSSEMIVNIKE